ncbi:MAG TPA: AraC family transcriptional regulator [Puia sp.]|jgi:AraC-like DNA-binding protein|nr:AraC family transcriptional regulator [Puia sp.]
MKSVELEKIRFDAGKSFKIFSPRLRNKFFWHYHPEIELVYVKADAGIRHVGRHISTYTKSDLVLIGGNVPHLNFDYRLRSDYHQTVIQLRTDFLGTAIRVAPELEDVARLFQEAQHGISFFGKTKEEVAKILLVLDGLPPLDQLLRLINVFEILALSSEGDYLNKDEDVRFVRKDKVRMGAVYEYIGSNYDKDPDVNVVAKKVNLTTAAFCRYFKRQTNMTFTTFVNQYRVERAKNLLMQGHNVSETCYEVGLDSLSYFTKIFKELVGENPSDFRTRMCAEPR